MEHWKKVFTIIWAGQFFSILSSTIVNFAIILWISIETRSAEMLAYAAIAGLLPQAILGPISGVLVDRWDRKRTMILADSFIAFCTLILAVLFWLDIAKMWHIFILLALRSVGSSFHMPAMQASVPLLAPKDQLPRIAGINQIIYSVCNIGGPALGALFLTIWDMEYVLMLDVVGAILACTSLLFVHIPNPERTIEKVRNVFREMREGITAIMSNRGLAWMFLFAIISWFFIMPVSVMFPLMTLDYFLGDKFHVSLIEGAWGVGALIGGAVMGIKNYAGNKVILVNLMYILLGATFLFSGLLSTDGFAWFVILTAIGGISGAIFSSAFTAIVQVNVDSSLLGRVFSMYNSMGLIPSTIGLIWIGFFADSLGVATSFIVCGAINILAGILAFTPPSLIRLDRKKKNSE